MAVKSDPSIRFLIDITQTGLDYIHRKGHICTIGATTTMAALEASPLIRGLAGGILAQAAGSCGSVQIRNMATLGGNLSNGCPAADAATVLLALEAEIVVAHQRGRKARSLAALYSPLREGFLHEALIVEIAIPTPLRSARWSFRKLGRTEVDISLVNVAAGLQLDSRDRVKWVRIALGAVANSPIRAVNAETLATGRAFDEVLIEEICDEVAREVTPITDVRASAEYRRTLCRVLTARALRECAARTGCSL